MGYLLFAIRALEVIFADQGDKIWRAARRPQKYLLCVRANRDIAIVQKD
jgi:hypothetical protein